MFLLLTDSSFRGIEKRIWINGCFVLHQGAWA
jgi:hypothetical protein